MSNNSSSNSSDRPIYFLKLEKDGKPKIANDQILTVEKNSILHLEMLNGTDITDTISLLSNAKENFPFGLIDRQIKENKVDRDSLKQFVFHPIENSTSLVYEIELNRSGPAQFVFIYNDPKDKKDKLTTPFYVIVQPEIKINNRQIDLSSIHLQTILSKSLGKVKDFEKYYEEASKLKFNFVHFTPIQKLGVSESLYCLRDNTQINDIFFDSKDLSNDEKLAQFKESLDISRSKYGIGGIVDIVLNHAADNSEWLGEHPECGYNLVNTPWLNCAYELDKILMAFSDNFCDCKTKFKFQPYIHNEAELNEVCGELMRLVNNANLHEYFHFNIEERKKELNSYYEEYEKDKEKYKINEVHINNENGLFDYFFNNCIDKLGEERNGVVIDMDKFGPALIKFSKNKGEFIFKAEKMMKTSNDKWTEKSKQMLAQGIENVKGGMRYEFVQNHNKAVKRVKPLIWNYFAVFDKNDKNKIFACNGWIMESDDKNEPNPNFTKKNSYYYYKRKVMIWSDCPKLNYGTCPEDCPYLMQHMTKYVQDMAKIFNGFRLDNAHSTPIYVAEYLAQQARKVNPDLVIMAELFTTKENEIKFVNRIGINLLIRELIWCHDAGGISAQVHRFGGGIEEMLGKVDDNIYRYKKISDTDVETKKMKYLVPRLPNSIIYDLTHDNETYYQKLNNLALNISFMACCSFSHSAIGSTRGFDQLFPIQPSVVNEARPYEYDQSFNNMFNDEVKEEKKEEVKDEKEKTIKFSFRSPNTNSVSLAIDCHGWKPDVPLKKISHDYFETEITLENHKRYYYKYVINGGTWVHDPSSPNTRDNHGNINNYIDVGTSQTVQPNDKRSFHVQDLKLFRRALNGVRDDLSKFKNEFYLHSEGSYVAIFRTAIINEQYITSPPSYDGYAMICRTGFDMGASQPCRIELPGIYSEFVCGASMRSGCIDVEGFKKNPTLKGTSSDVYFTLNPSYLNSITKFSVVNNRTVIDINGTIQPNTVIILKFKLHDEVRNALVNIEQSLKYIDTHRYELSKDFSMIDINLMLYKCEREELDNTHGKRGNYNINGWKSFVYAGICHLHQMLNRFKTSRDNHPILDNIRAGDWLLKYSIDRYSDQPNIKELYNVLIKIYDSYTKLYVHFKPFIITKIIDAIYNVVLYKIMQRTKNTQLVNFSLFTQQLIAANYQFTGYVESSRFKYNTQAPFNKLTISAGLPHFSSEYMRCWGRDTFIALKGLLLLPGYYAEAKETIINFASTMRHGLIPNLLDSGINSRYNARDATWFFMQAIVDYVTLSGDSSILNEDVSMVFLSDDYNEHNSKKAKGEKRNMALCDIMQHILQAHAQGINFREWRAGKQIDEQMKDEGFNIKIYLNKDNGFIYGGNKSNCGTWMDKMGSSEKAGNKGIPASPRNGADIEIIALLYSVLKFISEQNKKGTFKYENVTLQDGTKFTYDQWANLIKDNFEKYFYIETKNEFSPNSTVYRDYISDDNDKRHECQLRPNIFIAMTVAPDIFNKDHAIKCIEVAEKHLVVDNCVGIRTLDDQDKNYNGNYILSDDSNNYRTAHGFNYHNGPEWVFPFGYYLHSKILFNNCKSKKDLIHTICRKILPCEKYIEEDDWSGLPELTNKDGALCNGSCNTQAWSIGTVLDAVSNLSVLGDKAQDE